MRYTMIPIHWLRAIVSLAFLFGLLATPAGAVTTQYKDGFFCTIPITITGATLGSDAWVPDWRYNGQVWSATGGNNVIGISGTATCGNYTDITYSLSITAVGATATRTLFTKSGTMPNGGGTVSLAASFDPRAEKSWFGDNGTIQVSASVTIYSYSDAGYQSTAYSYGTIGVNYNANQLSWNQDRMGVPSANPQTEFIGGGPGCARSPGLPVFWVNTSFLNLAIEDTDFRYKSFGHDVTLTRAWNMPPGRGGIFGKGWSFTYESTLRVHAPRPPDAGLVRALMGSGQVVDYRVDASQGSTGVGVSHSCGSSCQLPILTGYGGSGANGYYTLEDKKRRLVSRYEFVALDASTGENVYRLATISDRNGNALTLAYDASSGQLAKLTDASGRQTSFSYGSNGRVETMQLFNGKTAIFEYDAGGNLVRNVDFSGLEIAYVYDTDDFMTSMTGAGKTTSFTYFADALGEQHIRSVKDAAGKTTNYAFGYTMGANAPVQVTLPGGAVREYRSWNGSTVYVLDPLGNYFSRSYDQNGRLIGGGGPAGGVSFEYDALGRMTKLTDRASQSTLFTYDASGNVTSKTDALSNTWIFSYDASGNLASQSSPLGKVASYSVNAKGLTTSVTQPDGVVLGYAYDSHGNLLSATDATGNVTSFSYDSFGLELVKTTDPRGNATAYSYDANRHVLQITHPDLSTNKYSYECNAISSFTDGDGTSTAIERDALLHVTKITDPSGNSTGFSYDDDGKVVSTTDPLGRVTALAYDVGKNLTSIVKPSGQTIGMGYTNGRLSSVKNEGGKECGITYDAWGKVSNTGCGWPTWGATTVRDALGRPSSVSADGGRVIKYSYDADGQLLAKKFDASTVVTFAWHASGRLASYTDTTGTKTYSRDAAGRAIGITYADKLGLSLGYDAAGNVSELGYAGGLKVTYTYDNMNRVSGVGFAGNSLSVRYSATGDRVAETRSNGVDSTYGYDALHRLTSVRHQKGAAVIVDLAYTRDAAGRITAETGVRPLSPVLVNSSVTASYESGVASNALKTWGSASYTFGRDGNPSAVTGPGAMSAQYDHDNRLTSITRGTSSTTFTYDGLGHRVAVKSANASARNFHFDPAGRLLFETDASGLVTSNYIYAGSRLVASGTVSEGFVFYHFDKTGNTLALTDSTGAVVAAYAYSPHGAILSRSGTANTPFTYVGAYGVMDDGNNLYHMRNRHYDALTGRFLQPDPIGLEGGLNLYAYVENNPVTGIDPEGLWNMDGGGGWERWNDAVQKMDPETKKTGAIIGSVVMLLPTAALILPELAALIGPATAGGAACEATAATGTGVGMSFGMRMAANDTLAALLTPGVDVLATVKNIAATPIGREILKRAAQLAVQYQAATVNTLTTGAVTSQLGGLVQVISQFMNAP